MERGALQRTTGVTKMNETSSRSHAVFTVIIEKSSVPGSSQGSESDDLAQLCGFGGACCNALATRSSCHRGHVANTPACQAGQGIPAHGLASPASGLGS